MVKDAEEWGDFPNLAAMMFARARQWPTRTLFRFHRDGGWGGMDWTRFARNAASAARSFRGMGITAGDRVILCAENRPEFAIAELGLMAIGAIPVPTYLTNTPADHAHVVQDSGARLAVVSNPALASRLSSPALAHPVIVMDRPDPDHTAFAALLATAEADFTDIERDAAAIPPEQLACLIYTSGTGGQPKGVMLPHRAILANCRSAHQMLRPLRLRNEVYFSFLPLSHAFEHTIGLYFLAGIGSEIAYARGLETMAADMTDIRPTVMLVVPRFLCLLRGRIEAQLQRQPRWQRRLANLALQKTPGLAGRLLNPVLDRLVRRKIRARFGGRLRAMMSGGAKLEPELGRFFCRLGIETMQGYGQTEAGPVISATPPGGADLASVGPPMPGVEARIAADGEILVRGDLLMAGYWNNPAATAGALQDGWLRTGDVGALDASGFIHITDRKKDFIVLSGGDKVSPARVEGRLMNQPEISQAVILGENQAGVAALLVPADGVRPEALKQAVTRVNRDLPVHERIRRTAPVPPFTIENGLLTPTLKIRRGRVIEAYGAAVLERADA
jgi:long-chain acyl-CoA synthetase